jgi:iron-sulfur cluster assembly accessory protein
MVAIALLLVLSNHYWLTHAWMPTSSWMAVHQKSKHNSARPIPRSPFGLHQSTNVDMDSSKETTPKAAFEEIPYDYEVPEDAIIHIKPKAMRRLRELRDQRREDDEQEFLTLRMGVRSGGCSGMSYVMDFCTADSVNAEDDQVDTYEKDRIQCVVDSKSMLYLYGLQLDYSTELIGGGFKFYNPNAEESCGCGSSFGV